MSTARIVRKSFNGGEIAPELHYRSDLEMYHNACKSLKNMTVTPWGAATRRPPTELLSKIDTATYGVPVKYLPFRFSLTETFHIIFTDGSGSASSDATTADFIVFDADGVLQTLDGASTKILTTVYAPADLLALHHIQVNDFIYMTCGGDYPVQALSRFFDERESGNRWQVEEWEFCGGPYGEINVDPGSTLSVNAISWDSSTTYSEGDAVSSTDVLTIDAAKWEIKGNHDRNQYRLSVEVPTHTFLAGDFVSIFGVTLTDGANDYSIDFDNTPPKGEPVPTNPTGPFEVVSVSGDWLTLEFRIRCRTVFNKSTPTINLSSAGIVKGGSIFYESIDDGNLGNALSDATKWAPVDLIDGRIKIVASTGLFKATDIGRLVSVQTLESVGKSGSFAANSISESFVGSGEITLTTEGGAWGGILKLRQSIDGGSTWSTIGSIRSINASSNGSIIREVKDPRALLRVELEEWSSPSGTYEVKACIWKIANIANSSSHFRITEFIDANSVMAKTVTPLASPIFSKDWKLGQFSETTGFANTLTIHDERMVFGGNKANPNTVWASRVNDWTNFLEGDTDVSPYTFTIKSDSFDTIRWMRSTRNLMIGTENSESTMGTRDDSAVISPTNIDVRTQTYFGSANIQAVVTADLVFFVQGQKQRVRSTQYDFGTDQYLSSEMSILAHHITAPGIKEMSFRRHPYSSIFFVLDDGRAVSFTYERDNQVKGWARMEFGGDGFIVSAASNYSDAGDIIGGIVKRGSEYTLETFGSFDSGTVYLDGQTQSDSGWSSGKALDYADTSGLAVVMDDLLLTEGTDYTWSGSTLTIPGHTDETVTVGWPFAFEIEPTDIIELGDHGAKKRISKLGLYLLDSGGCDIAVNGEDSPFQAGDALTAGDRLSGEHQISVGGGTESAVRIKLSGNHHLPFNISAFGVYGQPSR